MPLPRIHCVGKCVGQCFCHTAAVPLQVRQSLGPSDDIEAGTKALLAQEGVVEEDFDLEVSG